MARVFALRHLSFALVSMLLSFFVVSLSSLGNVEKKALILLFAVFYLLVAWVLLWIRVSRTSRWLLSAPLLILLARHGEWLIGLSWFAGLSVIEALRRESKEQKADLLFRCSLAFHSTVLILPLFVGGPGLVYGVAVWGVMEIPLLACACWVWQGRLTEAISELD